MTEGRVMCTYYKAQFTFNYWNQSHKTKINYEHNTYAAGKHDGCVNF